MLKRLLIVAATAVGVVAIQKKLRDSKAEQDLWAEATDDVRSTGG